jgi:hypothetical protein
LQSGWTKYAEDYDRLTERIIVVGAMVRQHVLHEHISSCLISDLYFISQPHDWLFKQVSSTIHHGGAGTTSAGLRAGNSTFICPFFGDQHFWAEMVSRAGVGPAGCPIGSLTAEILTNAFRVLKSEETKRRVLALSEKMNAEVGALKGVESFERNLPLEDMLCEVSLFNKKSNIAKIFCQDCGLKMCFEVDAVAHRARGGRADHRRVAYRFEMFQLEDHELS